MTLSEANEKLDSVDNVGNGVIWFNSTDGDSYKVILYIEKE